MALGKYGGQCVEGHTAFIFDRGGTKKIDQLLDLSMVRWERTRDGMTEATVVIQGTACSEQAELISRLRTHRHELVIFRGRDRVWEGPLHRVGSHRNYTEIVAKDVLAYLFATPLTQTWSNAYPDVGTVSGRIQQIIEYELTHSRVQRVGGEAGVDITVPAWESLDPPINVVPHLDIRHFPNEAETSAKTLPFEMKVGEHLASLARVSGIDYTTVGRSIVVWDVSRFLGRTRQLTEADFTSEVIVTEYGADHVQSAYVYTNDGVYGQALNQEHLDYYGPWTEIFTAYNEEGSREPSQAELNSQAQRNLAGRSPAPVEVRVPDNSGIILDETLTINHLVCGVQMPLLATLNARRVSQMQKLDHVTVIETPEGENIQVTLTPATKPDTDEEEP